MLDVENVHFSCFKIAWCEGSDLLFCPVATLTLIKHWSELMNDVLSFNYSLNTPPGTKIKLLGSVSVKNGFLLLDDSKISVLGGEVEHMIEKWELQRVRRMWDCHSLLSLCHQKDYWNRCITIRLIWYWPLDLSRALLNTAGVISELRVDHLLLCPSDR